MRQSPYKFAFEIDALPELPQKRKHWRAIATAADQWRNAVRLRVGSHRPSAPLARAHVTLIRRSSSEPDYDNLVASFKPVVDALTRSRTNHKGETVHRADVIFDDKPRVLTRTYRWEKAEPGKGAIRVEIIERLPCDTQPEGNVEGAFSTLQGAIRNVLQAEECMRSASAELEAYLRRGAR